MGVRRLLVIVAVVVALPVIVLSFCQTSYRWYEALQVEVETPQGVKTGRSVVRVSRSVEYFVPGWTGGKGSGGHRGEATVVEVLPGRYLFALLKMGEYRDNSFYGFDRNTLFTRVFPDKLQGGIDAYGPRMRALRETRNIPRSAYPVLVTFADLNVPGSVRQVDPDNLAATFGPGVRLKSLTLTMTNENYTMGKVVKILPWLPEWPGQLDGQKIETIRTANRFANSISNTDFSTGK